MTAAGAQAPSRSARETTGGRRRIAGFTSSAYRRGPQKAIEPKEQASPSLAKARVRGKPRRVNEGAPRPEVIVVRGTVDRTRERPPPAPRRGRTGVVLVGLVVALVAALAWMRPWSTGATLGAAERMNLERAAALRANGLDACARRMWTACVAFLDQAKGLDPPGDDDARVKAARAQAAEAAAPAR